MKKNKIRLTAALLCMLCMLLLPGRALAAEPVDTAKNVTLTVRFRHEGAPVAGVPFRLYRVADVSADAVFTLSGDFKKYPVVVNGQDSAGWSALADTLTGYALRDGLTPRERGVTDENGRLTFPAGGTLSPGLYLVVGEQTVADGFSYTTEPFLVCLPFYDSEAEAWNYDVEAVPKYVRRELPAAPPATKVSCKVLKVWKDGGTKRPENIAVSLLCDETVYDTVKLNAGNNWQYYWENLPEYGRDGRVHEWRVVEEEPEGYTVAVTREGITFVVTNTETPDTPPDTPPVTPPDTPPEQPPELPYTGMLWWPVPILAAAGLLFLLAGRLLGRRKSHE